MNAQINELQEIINNSHRIVFFCGAGVSTESNIPDFRSQTGLSSACHDLPIEEILSHHYFVDNPSGFYQFYRDKMLYPDALPNISHQFMADLEKTGKCLAVITQNIDGLHQLSGSKKVFELHGTVHKNECMLCHKPYDLNFIINSMDIPHCQCGGIIKPKVVLYGEALDEQVLMHAIGALSLADTLIILGTSLNVYPAAGLIHSFHGQHLVLINRDETPMDCLATLVLHESIGEILSQITLK